MQPFNIERKRYLNNNSYQKWTNWVEGDKIEVSEVRSTQSRGFLRVRSRVALHFISICTRQHNLLPVFPSGRSKRKIVSIVLPLKRKQNVKLVLKQMSPTTVFVTWRAPSETEGMFGSCYFSLFACPSPVQCDQTSTKHLSLIHIWRCRRAI